MFKIVANVEEWDTLYTSEYASKQLRKFLPTKIPYEDRNKTDLSRDGSFLIERLMVLGESNRPRMLLLISENGIGLEVASRIKSELPDAISGIMGAKSLGDSLSEQSSLTQFCQQLDVAIGDRAQQIKSQDQVVRKASSSAAMARWLAISAVVFAGLLASYSLYVRPTDSSASQQNLSAIVEEATNKKVQDLELQLARVATEVGEMSRNNAPNASAHWVEELKKISSRVEQIDREIKSLERGLHNASTKTLQFRTIEFTFDERDSGENILRLRNAREQSRTLQDRFGAAVLGAWIEPLGGIDRSDFLVLEPRVINTNQVQLRYQGGESLAPSARIRLHVLYRAENDNQ